MVLLLMKDFTWLFYCDSSQCCVDPVQCFPGGNWDIGTIGSPGGSWVGQYWSNIGIVDLKSCCDRQWAFGVEDREKYTSCCLGFIDCLMYVLWEFKLSVDIYSKVFYVVGPFDFLVMNAYFRSVQCDIAPFDVESIYVYWSDVIQFFVSK